MWYGIFHVLRGNVMGDRVRDQEAPQTIVPGTLFIEYCPFYAVIRGHPNNVYS
jgi:hypothetical protein